MIEAIKKLFTDEHAELISQRETAQAEFERVGKSFADRIEQLQTKPLRCLSEIDGAREDLRRLEVERDQAKSKFQISDKQLVAKIIESAPPAIDEKINQLYHEIDLTQGQLTVRGIVEKGTFGTVQGFVDSNSKKLGERVKAIRAEIERRADLRAAHGLNHPGRCAPWDVERVGVRVKSDRRAIVCYSHR
jgi:DNA repair exonuclease SbcCD ATPase subunit